MSKFSKKLGKWSKRILPMNMRIKPISKSDPPSCFQCREVTYCFERRNGNATRSPNSDDPPQTTLVVSKKTESDNLESAADPCHISANNSSKGAHVEATFFDNSALSPQHEIAVLRTGAPERDVEKTGIENADVTKGLITFHGIEDLGQIRQETVDEMLDALFWDDSDDSDWFENEIEEGDLESLRVMFEEGLEGDDSGSSVVYDVLPPPSSSSEKVDAEDISLRRLFGEDEQEVSREADDPSMCPAANANDRPEVGAINEDGDKSTVEMGFLSTGDAKPNGPYPESLAPSTGSKKTRSH